MSRNCNKIAVEFYDPIDKSELEEMCIHGSLFFIIFKFKGLEWKVSPG